MTKNKLKFGELCIGMKFYSFDKEDPDEYSIYYVIKTFVDKKTDTNTVLLRNFDEKKTIKVSYDEILESDKYVLIDNFIILSFTALKNTAQRYIRYKISRKIVLPLETIITDTTIPIDKFPKSMEGYYITSCRRCINEKFAIYQYETKKHIDTMIKYLVISFTDNIRVSDIEINSKLFNKMPTKSDIIKFYKRFNKVLLDNYSAITNSVWVYITFQYIPNFVLLLGYIEGKMISLKEYTVDYPDNIIPQSYMQYIINNSDLSKEISAYELFEYDESINLENIKYPYLILYSFVDDAYYVMLYKTGETLYKLNYNRDPEIKEVVDFMLKHKK